MVLEQKLSGAVLTTEQATQKLRDEFTLAVGKFDDAVGLTPTLVKGLESVAGSMTGIGSAATAAVTGVQALLEKVGELYSANGAVLRQQGLSYQEERARRTDAARDMGTANAGGRQALADDRAAAESAAARAARAAFRAEEIAFANKPVPAATVPTVVPANKQISLADFAVPGGSGGSGSGGSSKEKLDAYERELLQIDKRTKALQLEAQMVGKSTFESSKARAALELETATKKAGIPLTDEMRAAIDRASTGYANAKVKVEEVTKAYEGVQDAQKFFGDAVTDSLTDIIVEGEKAEDVVKNLAKALAKAAIQAALVGSGPIGSISGIRRAA